VRRRVLGWHRGSERAAAMPLDLLDSLAAWVATLLHTRDAAALRERAYHAAYVRFALETKAPAADRWILAVV
jgi:hypothetical protein